MLQIGKRLTPFVWYAAPLDLTTAFSWKSRIGILRRINPAGAGYVSFDPKRPANSLTLLNTGDSLTLDATGILSNDPATFFPVDNGNVPLPSPVPDTMQFIVPVGAPQVVTYMALRVGKPVSILALQSSSAADVHFSINGGVYVDYTAASAQIAALPASTFQSYGAGYTIQAQLTTKNLITDEDYLNYLIQQYEL
jgi:hypothetical protein